METTCPICKDSFYPAHATLGAPEDGFRESYCSEECRDQAERCWSDQRRAWAPRENQRRAYPGHWMPPDPFPFDELDDPFAE